MGVDTRSLRSKMSNLESTRRLKDALRLDGLVDMDRLISEVHNAERALHEAVMQALPQMLDELEALRKAGFRVNADGHQFVRGVTLSQAPLGDEWDARWRADLEALEKALGDP